MNTEPKQRLQGGSIYLTLNLIIMIFLLQACDLWHEGLDVTFKTVFTSDPIQGHLEKVTTSGQSHWAGYDQYGVYIGSITPTRMTAELNSIRYLDRNPELNQEPWTMVEIVGVNWPADDPRRLADFSNGSSVEVVPDMWGNVANDGWFEDEHVILRYLGIFPTRIDIEWDLPPQLNGTQVGLWNFERNGLHVKGNLENLLNAIVDQGWNWEQGVMLKGFVFGETDSSYVVRQDNIQEGDIRDLITMAQPHAVARSGYYTSPILTPPREGETKVITTTISFDTEGLILHYTGYDSMAYTNNDVFIIAPRFWERFSIVIDQN